MKETDVRAKAFAMPLTSPAFPPGPYRFVNREYLIITYRTDPERLRALVPEPLEVTEPVVKYEFIRMPDSTGFGDYTETGQVIPVSFQGRKGGYTHCMFLNDEPPIAGGRELWGFPKKLASPSLRTEIDMLVGTLDYGPVRVATGTMAYKHKQIDAVAMKATLSAPNFLLKIIRMSTAAPAFANWSNTTSRTSPSRAHGPVRVRCRSARMPWHRSPNCRCWKFCRQCTFLPISPWGSARSPTTISHRACQSRSAARRKWPSLRRTPAGRRLLDARRLAPG